MAISKRLKLRRSRNGGGTRSVCPSLKHEGNCAGNAACKWNVTLSKCRKKRVSKKSSSKKISTDVTKQLSKEIKQGAWGDDPEAIKTGLWMLKRIKYNPLYKCEFTGETYEHRKHHELLQARDKLSAYGKYGGFYPDGNDKRLTVPEFS